MPEPKEPHLPSRLPRRVTTPIITELSQPNYGLAEKKIVSPVSGRSYYGSKVDGQTFIDADHALNTPDEALQLASKKIGTQGRERVSMYEEILKSLGREAAQRYLELGR
jgi:hypothetical protein